MTRSRFHHLAGDQPGVRRDPWAVGGGHVGADGPAGPGAAGGGGPGRGTLMADALRAIAQVAPGFRAALRLHLIETSPRLRAVQAERLPGATWHDDLGRCRMGRCCCWPTSFSMRCRSGSSCGARGVDGAVRGRWALCGMPRSAPSPRPPPARGGGADVCPPPLLAGGDWGEGAAGRTTFELNEPALAMARSLGSRLSTQPGAALFLDYGPEHSAPGDSLQALRDGQPADPLAPPAPPT